MHDEQREHITREYIGRGVDVYIEFRPVSRFLMRGAVPTLPHISTRPETSSLLIFPALCGQSLCALQDAQQGPLPVLGFALTNLSALVSSNEDAP